MSDTVQLVPGPPPRIPAPMPHALPTSTITDPPTFRSHFPEFGDDTVYPDARVQLFIDTGSVMLNPYRWGSYMTLGVELFTGHMLALGQYAALRAAGGGAGAVPGISSGLMTNKSVSKVSVGYDVSVTAMEGAGPWNYTIYGQQLYWWMQVVGTGGVEMLALTYSGAVCDGAMLGWAVGAMGVWTG